MFNPPLRTCLLPSCAVRARYSTKVLRVSLACMGIGVSLLSSPYGRPGLMPCLHSLQMHRPSLSDHLKQSITPQVFGRSIEYVRLRPLLPRNLCQRSAVRPLALCSSP
jgi:hypothetical protein